MEKPSSKESKPKIETVGDLLEQYMQKPQADMSRRAFVGGFASLGLAGWFGGSYASGQSSGVIFDDTIKNTIEEGQDRNEYMKTALETSMFYLGESLVSSYLYKKGLVTGNASQERGLITTDAIVERLNNLNPGDLEKEIVLFSQTALTAVVLAPIVEELFTRGIPSTIVDTIKKEGEQYGTERSIAPIAGLATSLYFAYMHNIVNKDEQVDFDLKTVPVEAFLAGVFWWYLIRLKGRGLSHTIFSHAQVNLTALTQVYGKAIYKSNILK